MASLKRRDILILATFWLVGCALVMVLLGIFYSQSGQTQAPPPPPVATYALSIQGATAKESYTQALETAQIWQADVELVAASTYWPEATLETVQQFNTWDFRFFSPARQRLYFTIVNPDEPPLGRAHIFKQEIAPTVIDPAAWLVDSNEALTIWINNGGGPFLETFPGSSVELLLRQLADLPTLVWDVVGVSQDQSQLFYLSIDAGSGAVLN